MGWSRRRFTIESKKLMKQLDGKLSRSLISGINNIRDFVKQREILDLLREGRIAQISNIIEEQRVEASLFDFKRELRNAYVAGGELAEKSSGIDFQFNPFDSITSTFVDQYIADKIVQVSDDIKRTIGHVVLDNASRGINPLQTAREIRGSIGLTTNQYNTVRRYRENLENLESFALERKLRDRRFDNTVQRAIANNNPLSKKQIDNMVERYQQRYIKYRSETIARTESTRLMNEADSQYWRQLQKDRNIPDNAILSFWIYTKDGKAREVHSRIPGMNPDGVPLGGNFDSMAGAVKRPGTFATADQNINCRCRIYNRIITSEL